MESSWTDQLLNRSVESVDRWEALPCVVKLSGGYSVQIEGLWRLLVDGALTRTREDEGQVFGHRDPVNAMSELSEHLIGCRLASVEVAPGTADLILGFGNRELHVVSTSAGYEAWQVEGPQGTVAVGQGGGSVAVWG
ncbi:DUF6188 family protein [Arenimonas sp.]|uniref:DUF6188 family protein n=1 Tax=Arenimonas sp. TaxID=1872635 RepID=UPI0039C868BC